MNIKKGDIVTLSNSIKYIVLCKVLYNNNNYLYLTSLDENHVVKICLEKYDGDSIKLLTIENPELIKELIPLFGEDIQSIL